MNKIFIILGVIAALHSTTTSGGPYLSLEEYQHSQVSAHLKALTTQPGRKSSKLLRRIRRLRSQEADLWSQMKTTEYTAKTDTPIARARVTFPAHAVYGEWIQSEAALVNGMY